MRRWQRTTSITALACLMSGYVIASHGNAAGADVATPRSAAIKLVRAQPTIVRRACRDAQKYAGVRVTCPTLIPKTHYVRRTGLWGGESFSPWVWMITFNNGDNGRGHLHWIAGGGTVKAIRHYVLGDSQNVVKGLPRVVSRRRVSGYSVAVYTFPPYPAGGPNGGHTLALVRCGGRGLFASIHAGIHGDDEAEVTAMAVDLARRSGCH
jgi:hypothetical protein